MLEDTRWIWRQLRDGRKLAVAPYCERAERTIKWPERLLNRANGLLLLHSPLVLNDFERRCDAVDVLEAEISALDEIGFTERARKLRLKLLRNNSDRRLSIEAFALVREATRRVLGLRHHRVQLIGGFTMFDGCLAEMATGEGKTITALLPAITAALAGTPVHVLTVNDYLARRDAERLRPVYELFGLSVGLVVEDVETEDRRIAYQCDVVYSTNKDIAFDYLRDRTLLAGRSGVARRKIAELFGSAHGQLLLRGLHFAIVDEADSIFIDEARTPLILSSERGGGEASLYLAALALAERLAGNVDYRVIESDRAVLLTDRGRALVAELTAGMEGELWRSRRAREELACQALSAILLYHRDREYILVDGKVQIVDESTGRAMPDRSWEQGLHQMIEAKEGVDITGARETLARVTYQRFFRRYLRLGGMSGTLREVASELWADYGLRTIPIETNRPVLRIMRGHRMCRDRGAKWELVVETVRGIQRDEANRPILVGTRSVGASEELSTALAAGGVAHFVLNARQDEDEAGKIEIAGKLGAVTVATNMAGRGTDIVLDEAARAAGGLHVILTEFHESSRIDRQLYGRSGRQGDPGTCEAITAVDDDLYRSFAGATAKAFAASWVGWPASGAKADWLHKYAQAMAERRNAGARRQTEAMEERLDQTMAFAPDR